MASIQKRGHVYRVRIIRRGYATLTRSFKTRNEAQKWARNTESSIDSGAIKPRAKTTEHAIKSTVFRDAAEHYLRTHSPLKRNHRSEAGIIKILINRWGAAPVNAIDTQEVAALRDEMIASGRSGATVGHYLNAVSVIYRMLSEEWALAVNNPTRGIKRPPQNPPRQTRLSDGAKKLLFEVCAESSEKLLLPIVRLALETGMRRGELISLKWVDIELEKRRISIHRTKNGSSRVIPASNISISILNTLQRDGRELLFPIKAESMRKHFERTVRRSAIRWEDKTHNPFIGLRFHDLRHEALSQLSDKGLNVIELSQFSGHRTLSMLARYTHPDNTAILHKINT